ncbi:MAG: hypothetical protein PVF56_25425 [Desulfobacterales bacterium]|jgi:hypothetical protein
MIRLIATCLVVMVLLIPAAHAEEKSFSIISCRSGTSTMLSASKELTVFSYDFKGINIGIDGDKTFENFTHRCMGVSRIEGDEYTTTGFCKYLDPDGDFFIVAYDGLAGPKPLPWEFVQGTGKWKGVKGTGTAQTITRGKPIAEGTFQYCSKITGTYELPQ